MLSFVYVLDFALFVLVFLIIRSYGMVTRRSFHALAHGLFHVLLMKVEGGLYGDPNEVALTTIGDLGTGPLIVSLRS